MSHVFKGHSTPDDVLDRRERLLSQVKPKPEKLAPGFGFDDWQADPFFVNLNAESKAWPKTQRVL